MEFVNEQMIRALVRDRVRLLQDVRSRFGRSDVIPKVTKQLCSKAIEEIDYILNCSECC